MKSKITQFNFKAIYIVFSLFITVPVFSQVPEFDNDKPATTVNSEYAQDFSQAWDNTKFYNQWDAVNTDAFEEADVANGYLQFIWPAKRILVSKTVNSIPYIIQTDLDYGAGSNRAGVVLRTNPIGTPGTTEFDLSADYIQQPTIADPAFNSVGIAFYPTEDGASMTVQFTGELNGAETTRTQILVPKPEAVTSLLIRGTLTIEDFGTSIYVYYNNMSFVRINLADKVGDIYTSGEVFDANMESKGTFTGMNVESMGKVAIAQRDAQLQMYSTTLLQQELTSFDGDKPATTVNIEYTQDFSQAWDNTKFYTQWEAKNADAFVETDVADGYLQFVWSGKRIMISNDLYTTPYTMQTDLDYADGSNRGGVVIRANPDNIDYVQEPLQGDPGFNSVGIAFYSNSDGTQMIVQFSGELNGASTTRTQILVPKPEAVTSLLSRGNLRIEDYGTSIYVYYNDLPFVRINLADKVGDIYSSGEVFDANLVSKGAFTDMQVESSGRVAIAQRDAKLKLYSTSIATTVPTTANGTYDFEDDIAGMEPANVSGANGTFTTNSDVARTNTLQILTVNSGNTAVVNLDAFPSASDYSVTWKENYGTATRAGMLLRGGTETSSVNEGLKEGYLFQSSVATAQLRIFKVTSAGYENVVSVALEAPGVGIDRWYRATAEGSDLTFEYSDDGTTFITASSATDATYTSGFTQFAEGYGQPIGDLFVDDIVYTPIPEMAQNATYDFEADVADTNPANVSEANGTFTTNSDVARTNTLQLLTASTGNTAVVNLDAFPSASDYSVLWKENYDIATRAGMLLRGGTETSSVNEGLKEGYLFQSSVAQAQLRIFKVTPAGYENVVTVALEAPGVGIDRWYRATVEGSDLTFEYSDDGTTFITASSGTDATYTSGLTQFAEGYGQPIGDLFVDNIVQTINDALSIEKNTLKNFTLYPNPARGTVNLLFNNNNGETSTITIYNIQGKLVKKIENKFENKASIDVSSLRQGVYLLKIKSASAEETKKLIIN